MNIMEPSPRIGYTCKVPSCDNVYCKNANNKRFFKFPKNTKTRKIWKDFCNIEENFEQCDNYRMCEDHFVRTDFIGLKKIKNFAVPSRKGPPSTSNSTESPVANVPKQIQNTNLKEVELSDVSKGVEIIDVPEKVVPECKYCDKSIQDCTCYQETVPLKLKVVEVPDVGKMQSYIFNSVKRLSKNGLRPFEVCRICLQPSANKIKLTGSRKQVRDIRNMLEFLFPEVNIDIYPDAKICYRCIILLAHSHRLKINLLKAEEVLKYYIAQNSEKLDLVDIVISPYPEIIQEHNYAKSSDESTKEQDITMETHCEIHEDNKENDTQEAMKLSKELTKSKRVDWGDAPYLCDFCGKFYNDLKLYQQHAYHHRVMNNITEIFTCDKCGLTLRNVKYSSIHYHRLKHIKERKRMKCGICQRLFENSSALRKHQLAQHPNAMIDEHSPCHICGKSIKRLYMMSHLKLHQVKEFFQCQICNKSFKGKILLKRHLKVHTNRYYNCDICGKILKSEKSLVKHIRLKHLGQGNVNSYCKICQRFFSCKNKLKQHLEKQHNYQ